MSHIFNIFFFGKKTTLVIALAVLAFSSYTAAGMLSAQEKEPPEPAQVSLTDAEIKTAIDIINNFLDTAGSGDKSHEKYITSEITDSCLQNWYMIDKYVIKNYKRKIDVYKNGEALCSYMGDDEFINQEFNIIKDFEKNIKINSISEKRYVKMNDKRRQCYLGTRSLYKIMSLVPALSEDMTFPEKMTFEALKSLKLLSGDIKCPSGGDIKLTTSRNVDTQNNEYLGTCSMHGDFFELYKLDEKLSVDYDKYNKEIDRDEAPYLEKLRGEKYRTFEKIQPVENSFYAALEKRDGAAMAKCLKDALAIDQHVGNMYLNMIRFQRAQKDDKGAKETFDTAIKVYPKWNELKNSLTDTRPAVDDTEEIGN